jgi:hypothetical protein
MIFGTYPCHTCKVPFPSWEALKAHRMAEHGMKDLKPGESLPRVCEMCGKTAIYSAGVRYFCAAHKRFAVLVQTRTMRSYDQHVGTSIDISAAETDRVNRTADRLEALHRGRKRKALGRP